MKIILLEDIKTLGKKGDVKEVAEGYARNFLLPKKIAEVATQESIKAFELQKEKQEETEKAKLEEMRVLADKIKNSKIVISAKEKDGKLFGSITAKTISEELKKKDLKVSENSIIIEKSIKNTGEHEIQIKLAEDIQIKIKLDIRGN